MRLSELLLEEPVKTLELTKLTEVVDEDLLKSLVNEGLELTFGDREAGSLHEIFKLKNVLKNKLFSSKDWDQHYSMIALCYNIRGKFLYGGIQEKKFNPHVWAHKSFTITPNLTGEKGASFSEYDEEERVKAKKDPDDLELFWYYLSTVGR